MKQTLIAISILMMFSTAYGAEIELSVRYNTYLNDYLDSGPGVNLKVIGKSGLYLTAGYDQTSYIYGGQHVYNADIFSAGLGMKAKLHKVFYVFGQIGWYQPQLTIKGNLRNDTSSWEGVVYEMEDDTNMHHSVFNGFADWSNPYKWEGRSIEIEGNVGGEIGAQFKYDIWGWAFGIGGSYRILELSQTIKLFGAEYHRRYGGHWELKKDQDFGGWSIAAQISKAF